jgi:hypothetical protein
VWMSSESAAVAKDKSKIVKSFVCTCRLDPVQICSQISVFQSRRIAAQRSTQATTYPVMLSEAKHPATQFSTDAGLDAKATHDLSGYVDFEVSRSSWVLRLR